MPKSTVTYEELSDPQRQWYTSHEHLDQKFN